MGTMCTVNNKLIAEFLNTQINSDDTYELPKFGTIRLNGDFKTSFTLEEMKFNKDWNWLMEVVERINNTGRFEVVIQYGFCYITDGMDELTLSFPASNTIEAVYQAVVEFIKWYNQQI